MGHHRVLGKTIDFITGREITDTDDERYRQKIARLLVERKGYEKTDIEIRRKFHLLINGETVPTFVDFVVSVDGRPLMLIKYGPGSLVTRERPALACSRLIGPNEIPLTVVTNGEDAEVIATANASIIATGLEGIPTKEEALRFDEERESNPISPERKAIEERVLAAYDWLEHSSECDSDWCAVD